MGQWQCPMRKLLISLAIAALAGPVLAQDSNPEWLKRPTPEDLLAVWPAEALKSGRGGRVELGCTVTVQGSLRDCRVLSEDPAGQGFGAAAMVLTRQLLFKPARKGGQAVEQAIRLPINFDEPDRATGSRLRSGADTPVTGERVVTGFAWKAAPTAAEVLAVYPAKARTAKVGGFVTLDCRVNPDGRLVGCNVAREEPRGHGFGQAARSLAGKFVAPELRDAEGKPIGRVRTHVPFVFAAEALESESPVIGRPRWTSLPQLEDFTAVIPDAARKAGVYNARVVISCTVAADGALQGCKSRSEEPAGLGYGQAAEALSKAFRMSVWSEDGMPTVGGTVRIPIRFALEEAMKERAAQK